VTFACPPCGQTKSASATRGLRLPSAFVPRLSAQYRSRHHV